MNQQRRTVVAALAAAGLPLSVFAQGKIVLGFAQIGAESEWRTANTESIKSVRQGGGHRVEVFRRSAEAGEPDQGAALVHRVSRPTSPTTAATRCVMLAAYHGHAEAVTALLAAAPRPDRANDRGQTPARRRRLQGRGRRHPGAARRRGRPGRGNPVRGGHGAHVRQGGAAGTVRRVMSERLTRHAGIRGRRKCGRGGEMAGSS